jgi:hypothetical protein
LKNFDPLSTLALVIDIYNNNTVPFALVMENFNSRESTQSCGKTLILLFQLFHKSELQLLNTGTRKKMKKYCKKLSRPKNEQHHSFLNCLAQVKIVYGIEN